MKFKVAVPARPWQREKIEPTLMNVADALCCREPMLRAFIGAPVEVDVLLDREAKRVTFVFRASELPKTN